MIEYKFLTILILNLIILKFHENFFKFLDIYDIPDKKRKIHSKNISLGGGAIILLNFILILFFFKCYYFSLYFTNSH